ncbi:MULTISPECIES: transporter substrate-binding domain-containing protein [unclassified Leisingera]|uniref:transporter substrate-binding domain-containing protein n=1 Tax=unclassified Leisingera TaxID=2614906 RepID=UPI000308D390|nr:MULTISPECIES: transporter substrate-binding domain-containing protein [unclassified Leisingera]KIC17490.1 ABC transporter substrate-binding protein [Leisingera sp. ANG-DT]KIC22694.1 ABC transporter substrate-binding protein [Leisingera sp. ANG-S3]KIC29719.1 ABC transporter substrate-binding protein [Leisingera sp. ANG-S5]KIC51662.1 ABC transporter substrate-binding protein [Leisingera sp. ANG-S]KID08848.1 ABC transporter substrate-binding protein [Leisingera sp. ANG1]
MTGKTLKTIGAAALAVVVSGVAALAGPIEDRIAAGEPIRIGFSNIPIWGYPDENGDAKGFVNEIALGILKEMGHENVETTVTDWGGLIPGLQANRYDMITGGLYILNSRCQNIAFSEPIAQAGDAFIVPAGNPKGIQNYQDILAAEALLVTGAGYNTVEAAKKEGLTDAMIMQVPGPTEMLAAVKAGRADAGGMTYFEAAHLAESDEAVDVTDPAALPDWTQNWVGVGFREADSDFMAKFNAALAEYVGTDAMMQSVEAYGYTASNLPGDKSAEWVCANR